MISNYTNISEQGNGSSISVPSGIYWPDILLGVFMYIIVLITFFGNVFVLISVFMEKSLQTAFNFFIVNLAITDLAVAVTAMWFYATDKLLGYWPFGEIPCGVWIFFDYGMTFASVFTLVAISTDRFWSVFWSLHYRSVNKRKKSIIMITIVWVAMLTLWLPPLMDDRLRHTWTPGVCFWNPAHNRAFVVVIAILGHHGPCVVMLFIYFRVYSYLKNRAKLRPMKPSYRKAMSEIVESKMPTSNALDISTDFPVMPSNSASNFTTANVATSTKNWDAQLNGQSEKEKDHEKTTNSGDVKDKQVKKDRYDNGYSTCDKDNQPEDHGVDDEDIQHTFSKEDRQNKARISRLLPALKEPSSAASDPILLSVSKLRTADNLQLNSGPSTSVKKSISFLRVPKQSKAPRQTKSKTTKEEKLESREMRVFVTLTYIIVGYLICWVPFHIVFDIKAIDPSCVPDIVYDVAFFLTYINSTINPFLYNFSSPEFRKAFKRIILRRKTVSISTNSTQAGTPSE